MDAGSGVAEATAHYDRFHRRERRRGFVPNPSAAQLQEVSDARRAEALDVLADALDGLSGEQRALILDRIDELQRRTSVSALAKALPPKREPVPHELEGCGTPTAEERRILDAGLLVRVRSDRCNHPRCRFARMPEDRHARIHEHARSTAG